MQKIQTKQSIRELVKGKRLSLSSERIDEASYKITQQISALEQFERASILFLYAAFSHEVQTHALHALGLKYNKQIAYPKVCPKTHTMLFYSVAQREELKPTVCGKMTIDEPDPILHKQVIPSPHDLMIVPGVAFDKDKNRLGYGGGFYDRYLKDYAVYSIGVGFEFQLLDSLPVESWDESLDCVLTEKDIIF